MPDSPSRRPSDLALRLTLSDEHFLGPGKVRLLELVDELGSISAAGRSLGMSYRRAWLLVDSLNAAFREPVVESAVGGKQGGGAALTPLGHEIIDRFRRMEAAAHDAVADDLAALKARTATTRRKSGAKAAVTPPRLPRSRSAGPR